MDRLYIEDCNGSSCRKGVRWAGYWVLPSSAKPCSEDPGDLLHPKDGYLNYSATPCQLSSVVSVDT